MVSYEKAQQDTLKYLFRLNYGTKLRHVPKIVLPKATSQGSHRHGQPVSTQAGGNPSPGKG